MVRISECAISGTLVGFLPFDKNLFAKLSSTARQKSSTQQYSSVISFFMGNLLLLLKYSSLPCFPLLSSTFIYFLIHNWGLEHNADPNVQDEYGELPLHKACSSGCYNIVKLLLEKGVDPNVQNGRGRFPLHTVSFRGYDGIVKLLLKYKANPNVQDGNGESPLHDALLWWHYNIAELLLKNRANPNVPDKNGKFPLNRARSSGRNDIAQLLLRNGADSGLKDKDDKKPIDRAFLRSNGGKPFNHKKAFWLGIAALLATAGSIALASGVADAYIGEVWCSVLAAVIAIIALCCVCCAAKTRLPPSGPSSVLYETSEEFSNSQKSLSPGGGA